MMSGRKTTVLLYTYIDRHARTPNKTKTKDTMSLDYSSIFHTGSRIGWVSKEYSILAMAVEMIMGNYCPTTIPTVHTYKCGVEIKENCTTPLRFDPVLLCTRN